MELETWLPDCFGHERIAFAYHIPKRRIMQKKEFAHALQPCQVIVNLTRQWSYNKIDASGLGLFK